MLDTTALAARRPPVAPGHVSSHAAFIRKDQAVRIDLTDSFPPEFPLCFNSFTVLFGSVERLFLKRSPLRFRMFHICVIPLRIPCSRSRSSRSNANVPVRLPLYLRCQILQRLPRHPAPAACCT